MPSAAFTPRYKRILLKLSGEALMGDGAYGISRQTIGEIVGEIAEIVRAGVEIGVVIRGESNSASLDASGKGVSSSRGSSSPGLSGVSKRSVGRGGWGAAKRFSIAPIWRDNPSMRCDCSHIQAPRPMKTTHSMV
mgnify:CR=1 FL=1